MRESIGAAVRAGALLTLCAALAAAAAAAQDRPPEEAAAATEDPREIGLVERARRGLAQLDVSVRGPADALAALGADDFDLVIEGRTIERLVVDRLCPAADGDERLETREAPRSVAEAPAAPTGPRPASYLFYFDQLMLTMAGRQNAIDTARDLIAELVRDGSRGAIVSSGKRLTTFADLTDDPDLLLEALDRLERDREQWVLYPQEEEYRIREVLQTLEVSGINSACGAARRFQREESWQTDRALRLFSLTLGHLAELDPPKVAFYFADMTRANAGMHFLTYVGGCGGDSSGIAGGPDAGSLGGFGATFAIDQVVAEAAAHGTRVYTVRAEGLVAPGTTSMRQGIGAPGVTNYQRYAQAGDSLIGVANETGGRSFINGEGAGKIVKALDADLGCMYLLSFDPTDLPQDRPLRVLLRMKRPKVKAYARGQMVLQSESARRTSKLMAAFSAPGSVRPDTDIQGIVVPTGFSDGRYTALVQIRAPGSPLGEATWDLGASLLSRGELRTETSSRVSVTRPWVPVVVEAEMSFKPGPYELILVAHEAVADQLGTERVEGSWPEREDGAAIGPIAVIQPADAVFVRDGETRSSGALARGERELLRTDLPTALVGLVCRGDSKKERLQVERLLIGQSETSFPALELDLSDERCAQFRDLIPSSTMTPGRFVYRVRLIAGGEEVAAAERAFAAIDGPGGNGTAVGSAP